MTRNRRNSQDMEFLTLAKRCAKNDLEKDNLEQLLAMSCEDPETFRKEWLRPLLEEGLDLDQAFDLVVEGVLRPS